MGVYNLERLTFLLVDDNRFVVKILQDVLKTLGAGQVITAENGVEAIEFLGGYHGPYGCPVDIIISDLVMAPIDGHLLLKWVRQGKDSPNRFMPFIMMSGAADTEHVEKARDGGANEFLAKPFSAQTVCDRILEVIDFPRQFVATRDYFGPDRHRRSDAAAPQNRRRITEKDATIVYSSDRVRRPKNPGDVYLFRLPNKLKEKYNKTLLQIVQRAVKIKRMWSKRHVYMAKAKELEAWLSLMKQEASIGFATLVLLDELKRVVPKGQRRQVAKRLRQVYKGYLSKDQLLAIQSLGGSLTAQERKRIR